MAELGICQEAGLTSHQTRKFSNSSKRKKRTKTRFDKIVHMVNSNVVTWSVDIVA